MAILFDDAVRDQSLALQPEIVTEGSDAARLPRDIRQSILRDLVSRIAAGPSPGGDNTEIARIAHGDITDETLALTEMHGDNDEVVFFLWLSRLAGRQKTSAAAGLTPIALGATHGIYARIASARTVAAVSGEEALRDLRHA